MNNKEQKEHLEEYLNKLAQIHASGNRDLIRIFLKEGTLKLFLVSNGYPKDAYKRDPDNMDLEVNYSEKISMLNDYYEGTHDKNMLNQLNDALCSLLEGDQHEVFVCLNLIATQLRMEENGICPFSLDKTRLLKKIEETLSERKEELSQGEVLSLRHNYCGTIENYGKIVCHSLAKCPCVNIERTKYRFQPC